MKNICECSQVYLVATLAFLLAVITHPFEKGVKVHGFYAEMLKGWWEVVNSAYA